MNSLPIASNRQQIPTIPVSVVIPTLNRGPILCETVSKLLTSESNAQFELIIIDQSDHNDLHTTRFLEKLSHRLIHQRVSFKSLPRARNEGLSIATNDVVVFIDDDVVVSSGFLTAHLEPYKDERVCIVTGPCPLPNERVLGRHEISDHDHGLLSTGKRPLVHVDYDFSPCGWAVGCNLSVRKSTAIALGGFDENFIANAVGEDAEFCVRVRRHGGIIYYAGKAGLVHLQVETGGCRTEIGATYVKSFAYNQYYLNRSIRADWRWTLKDNIRSYRRLVLNRTAFRRLRLHFAFGSGLLKARLKRTANLRFKNPVS